MYPLLKIDLKKFENNIETIYSMCQNHNLSVMAVTKVFCADEKLVKIVNNSKIEYIADSRIENLRLISSDKKKVLLRIPSLHQTDEVVSVCNISLNSELAIIKALDSSARSLKKIHEIILMIDIGDLREGVYHKENVINIIRDITTLKHIKLLGIGANLTCYGGIIPDIQTLEKLIDVIILIKKTLGIDLQIVSGGNSSHLHLLKNHYDIPYINNLRVGEAFVLGRETAFGNDIDETYQDVFVLEADLIELKFKPSIPEGQIGMNAFGEKPTFEDYGLMKRGILGIGRQDVDFHELEPYDKQVRFIGSSSDHIIVDLTHTDKDYKVGDILKFKLSYGSLLSLMTSQYVRKIYVE